jgi:D-alanyl-D-alanine carboxypeptidase (penicillin-binding protein 5/6)
MVSAGVTVVVFAALAARILTLPFPAAETTVDIASRGRLAGVAPALAWPAAGQAALATATGTVIGSSGPELSVPVASVTKIMTAYVVLRDHPLGPGSRGPALTISPAEAARLPAEIAAGDSVLAVHAGERLDELDALQALLLPSADNIADALARFDAGTIAAFVAEMNAAARRLGMTSTVYADASGLDPRSRSTAEDQLRLARAAMALPVFAGIVGRRSAGIPGIGTVVNFNHLVGRYGFTGIKTGSTDLAGGCLIFSVTRPVGAESYTIVGAVLGQRHGSYVSAALQAALLLVDSLYQHLADRTVEPAGTAVVTASRADRTVTAQTTTPLRLIGLPGQMVSLHLTEPTVTTAGRIGPGRLRARTTTGQGSVRTPAATLRAPSLYWRLDHLW